MSAELAAAPPALTADLDKRTLSGLLLPYDQLGHTSVGAVIAGPGSVTLPDPLGRAKLFLGHDRERPIGVLTAASESATGLHAVWRVGTGPDGDRALRECADQIRDGLSVELDALDIRAGRLVASTLTGAGLVAIPAFPAALAADQHPAPPAPDPDPDPDPAKDHAMSTDTLTPSAPAPVPPPDPTPAPMVAAPAAALTASATFARPVSALTDLARRLAEGYRGGGTTLLAALADITPSGNGTGHDAAGLAVQALGELWGGVEYVPLYQPLLAAGELTGVAWTGWRWNVAPKVSDYLGNKAEIPTNPAKLEAVTGTPKRLAGGHDLDRIYRDLGNDEVLVSYWRAMAESYAVELDAHALASTIAAAPTTGAAASSLAVARISGALAVPGATFCLAAADVILDAATTTAALAPAGLDSAGVAGLTLPPVTPAPDLAAGTVIVGARQAVRFLTMNPPVRLEAANIPRAGIDAALYGYWGAVTENGAALAKYAVTVAAPAKTAAK